jgi:hypothetical protein
MNDSASIVRPPAHATTRPLERLEAEIVELAGQITGATARLIGMIGEFDAAEGYHDWGMRSTAHWLSWQCGIGLTAGREQVRVARKLRDLPLLTAAFAEGRISYSKVRALTRFATPATEDDLVAMAECSTAAQIERLASGARRARSRADVQARHADRYVTYRWDEDGSLVGSFRLPPEDAAVFLRGLEIEYGKVSEPVVEGDTPREQLEAADSAAVRSQADALVRMAAGSIENASAEASPANRELYQLVIHTPREALVADDSADPVEGDAAAELAPGVRLHPSTLRRLSCDCPTTEMTDDADGAAIHVGRRSRRIKGRLRRAVEARDRGSCRAPSCSDRATQIHHIRHWANGGSTCLRNLISLCDAHHWLVHEGGWLLVPRRAGVWALLGPTGVVVDPVAETPPPSGGLAYDPKIAPDAVTGQWDGSRFPHRTIIDDLAMQWEREQSTSAEAPDD